MSQSAGIIWNAPVLKLAAENIDAGLSPADALDQAIEAMSRKSVAPKKVKPFRCPPAWVSEMRQRVREQWAEFKAAGNRGRFGSKQKKRRMVAAHG